MTLLFLMFASAWAAEDFEDRLYLFGDIHGHTGASGDGGSADLGTCVRASDGEAADCGTVLDLAATATSNGLDFLATVDHVTSEAATTSAEDFEQVFHWVNDLNDPAGGLITLPGAEIFAELPDGRSLGHRSLMFFGTPESLAEVTMGALQPSGSVSNFIDNCAVLTSFMATLESNFGPVLLIPHHPGVDKPMATDWDCHDPRWAPVVEAYSEHGSSFDASSGFDPPWSGFVPSGTVKAALDPGAFGHRLGLVGGSDNHDSNPGNVCRQDSVLDHHPYGAGLTGAIVEPVSSPGRVDVFDAFTSRRTFTTTGPQLPVWVDVSTADTTVGMGEVLTLDAESDVQVDLRMPPDAAWTVQAVRLMGPLDSWMMTSVSPGVWTTTVSFDALPAYLMVDVTIDGELWFDAPCEDGGMNDLEHIWTSPTWIVSTVADDADEDGFSETDGDCDDANPFVYPGAPEACDIPGADHDCDGERSAIDSDCDSTDSGTPADPEEDVDSGGVAERPPIVVERPPKAKSEGSTGCASVSRTAQHGVWFLSACLMTARRRRSGSA